MGRPIKNLQDVDLAYISGFLDGDGSIMVQVKKTRDRKSGWRLMFTICFYQDSRHEKPLFWIQKKLDIGYISRRNDGMTELRINGYRRTKEILEALHPYIKFKKKQVKYVLKILSILEPYKGLSRLKKNDRVAIAKAILAARQETYQSGSKRMEKLKADLKKIVEM